MNELPEISVVVPVFNEEKGLEELFRRLASSVSSLSGNYELLFVDDGSRDSTFEKLSGLARNDKRVRFIRLSRNFGHQVAVTAGLDHCRGEAVVIIDGDLQDPPEIIPELYRKYKEGYKVVYARRIVRKGESYFKKVTARLFYRLLSHITSIEIPLDTGDFRLIDREVVNQLKKMPEKDKYLRGQIAWIGFRQTFVDFERDARKYGTTGYPLRKMIRFAIDGITAFSDFPLKLATMLGFIVSIIAVIIIIYALYSYFILERTITGWTLLIVSTMFIGGIQLITIGIIGEYVSRINHNVRNRPLYIVEETNIEF